MFSTVISSLSAIIAVFVSYYLGKEANKVDYKRQKLQDCYQKFYMELFKKLMRISFVDFEKVIEFHGTDFPVFLLDNMEYMTPELTEYIPKLYAYSQEIFIHDAWSMGKNPLEFTLDEIEKQETHEHFMKLANVEFSKFVTLCCKQSIDIANRLEIEPVAESFLKINE